MRKLVKKAFIVFFALFLCGSCLLSASNAYASNESCKTPGTYKTEGEIPSGSGIVPNNVISNIYLVNYAVDEKVSDLLVLGDALWCYATHYGANDWTIGQHVLFSVPNFSILISGIFIWIIGLLLVFAVAYYLVDLSFKLAFAVMAMPIAIALWPFPATKKKLFDVISLMLHCTGVFIFLCLGVTFTIALIKASYSSIEGFDSQSGFAAIYTYINEGQTEPLAKRFDIGSVNFLLLLFAGIYGFRLVGTVVDDYAKKFFNDSTGMGSQSPMHSGLTQMTSFVKNQAAKPFKRAKDIVSTQAKRGLAKGYGAVGGKLAAKGGFTGKIGQAMNNVASDYEDNYQNQRQSEDER